MCEKISECRILTSKYKITGIDISSKQIELAKRNVPEGSFYHRDIQSFKPGGTLIVSLAYNAENGYTEDDFFGKTMYWSNYDLDQYRKMLKETGFGILRQEELGHGYQDKKRKTEHHPVVIAIKKV